MYCTECGNESGNVVNTVAAFRAKGVQAEADWDARFIRTRVLEKEIFTPGLDGTEGFHAPKKAETANPMRVLSSIRELFPGLKPLLTLRERLAA